MLRRPIFFIIGIIILLVLFGWIIFSIPWGGSDDTPSEDATPEKALTEYADTDAKVRLNQNGKIVNDQEHREIWITVSRGEVLAEVKQGYEGTIIESRRIPNNPVSFRVFLAALAGQNFTKTQEYKGVQDETGACPSGIRYIFDVYDNSGSIMHSWTTSCSRNIGTFDGDRDDIRRLFHGQVPNYNDFAAGIDLN
jgi:hypothetical protein